MASIPSREGSAFGTLVLVASGAVALCCAVIVVAGRPAPDEPNPPERRIEEARAVAPAVEHGAEPAAEPVPEPPAPVEPTTPQAEPPAPPRSRVQPPPPYEADPPTDPESNGYLHVYSTPQARIFIDGSDTGLRTPIRGDKLQLSPGRHKVTFVIDDSKYTYSVRIRSGQAESITKTFAADGAAPP